MYHEFAKRLALSVSDAPAEVSEAVSMEGYNAAQIDATIMRLTGTNVTIVIQLSNDLQNWRTLSGSTETFTAEDYQLGTIRTGIAAAYIRLKYQISGSAGQVGIFGAGVHLSNQT